MDITYKIPLVIIAAIIVIIMMTWGNPSKHVRSAREKIKDYFGTSMIIPSNRNIYFANANFLSGTPDSYNYANRNINTFSSIHNQQQPTQSRFGYSEEKCRSILEDIFKVPFPKVRPAFLKNPYTNRPLELDMYNDKLKLAVEFDGQQHAEYSSYFHKTHDDYIKQVGRDKMKDEMCKMYGIKLIRIPHTVKYHELESYIKSRL
jgi:hypothetical protein